MNREKWQVSPLEALDQEFSCYYQADELPALDIFAPQLHSWATDSGERLLYRVNRSEWPELATLLDDVRRDPRHPVVKQLQDATCIGWGDPDEWPYFGQIVTTMRDVVVKSLRLRPASGFGYDEP